MDVEQERRLERRKQGARKISSASVEGNTIGGREAKQSGRKAKNVVS